MRGEDFGVTPVFGQPALEVGDLELALLDRGLDQLELAAAGRLRLLGSRLFLALLRLRRRRSVLAGADAGVVGPAAGVGAEASVLDRDDPLGDGVEHSAVVGDEQDRARKRLECGLEGFTAFEVEVVGRLVEDEKVRSGRDDEREPEPPSLTAGELVDPLLVVVPAGEQEPAEERLRLRSLQAGGAHRALEHAAALVELHLVL